MIPIVTSIALSTVMILAPHEERLWEDEIVYVVVVQKFFDGDPTNNFMRERYLKDRERFEGGFWGGDLKGVIAKLDDLAALGVTTLLLYPVMQNDEGPIGKFLPTGYRPKDYESVDKNFGDIATLRTLVNEAHARKLRVILDMPLGMPGFDHPYVKDPAKRDWFGDPTEYGARRWKVENPVVADYIIGVAKRWKERSGCDGFRMDSAPLHPASFWKRFVHEVKEAPPKGDFVVIAELAIKPRRIGEIVAEAKFDSAYDFSFMEVQGVFGKDENVGKISFIMKEAKQFYSSRRAMMAQIDNYEDPTFVAIAREPKAARTKLALTFLLTIDRVPALYAGDELGLSFREAGGAFPPDRIASPFLKDVKSLISLRKKEPALRRGDFHEVLAHDSMYAFTRVLGDDHLLIVLNGASKPRKITLPLGDRAWRDISLEDLLADLPAKAKGHDAPIVVEPFSARVFRVR